jgi:hypothetical protein
LVSNVFFIFIGVFSVDLAFHFLEVVLSFFRCKVSFFITVDKLGDSAFTIPHQLLYRKVPTQLIFAQYAYHLISWICFELIDVFLMLLVTSHERQLRRRVILKERSIPVILHLVLVHDILFLSRKLNRVRLLS